MVLIQIFIILFMLSCLPLTGQAQWLHEPTGFGVISDYGFSQLPVNDGGPLLNGDGQGWALTFNINTQLATDATAPVSPPSVMKMTRDPCCQGGGKMYYDISTHFGEMYMAFQIKPSNPFTGYANLHNKLAFLMDLDINEASWMYTLGNQGGPFEIYFYYPASDPASPHYVDNSQLALEGNTGNYANIYPNRSGQNEDLGQWNLVELYLKASSCNTCKDGIVKWWVHGVLSGEYYTLNTASRGWNQVVVAPSWDAPDASWTTSWREWDHIHISAPGGSGGSGTPPAAPTGLTVR